MMQKLILPINMCRLTASMKTPRYRSRFGFEHYGVDLVSDCGNKILYASGNGIVAAAGRDGIVGNVVALCYPSAKNCKTGQAQDILFRYFHLGQICVKEGQRVDKDTVLGVYGNTGSLIMAPHLHLEADLDTAHPLYSPTVRRSDFLRGTALGANDQSVVNPLDFLHCKISAPDSQTFSAARDDYVTSGDRLIETVF